MHRSVCASNDHSGVRPCPVTVKWLPPLPVQCACPVTMEALRRLVPSALDPAELAIRVTVILLHPPLHLVGVLTVM